MPQPKENETRKDFVSRCIPIVLDDGTADEQDQAVAVCNSMWEKAQEGKSVDVKAVTKSEADGDHPASHYLVVEDKEKPTTWHLRVKDASGKLDARLMGAAWAALHGGYRGNVYEGPGKQEAITKLKKLYKQEGREAPGKSVAVKFLRDEDQGAVVGGYIALWGSPATKDLQGDYFTPETWLALQEYPTVPALFHHGLDDTIGASVIGKRIKSGLDDVGAWVEDWLDKGNQYWKMVKPLLDKEALYYSPGSAPHLVKRENDGMLKAYPIIEDTLTVIPAQHRLRPIEQIKAAYKAAGLEFKLDDTEPDEGAEGGDFAGAECQDAPGSESDRLKARAIELLAEIEMITTEDM